MRNKAEYFVALVNEFSKRHKLTDVQAFRYLDRYGCISLIDEHYNISHTLTFDDVIDGLTAFSKRHGGALS